MNEKVIIIIAIIVAVLLFIVIALLLIGLCFVQVKQGTRKIVERFGVYHRTLKEGIRFILWPFDRIAPVPWEVLSITQRDEFEKEYVKTLTEADGDLVKQVTEALEIDLFNKRKDYYLKECNEMNVEINPEILLSIEAETKELAKTITDARNIKAAFNNAYDSSEITPSSEIQDRIDKLDALKKSDKSLRARKERYKKYEEHRLDYIDLRERFIDSENSPTYKSLPVITKDNASIKVNTVIFFSVVDVFLYYYGANEPEKAMELLTISTLRNLIGTISLEEALVSRTSINEQLRETLDTATNAWGIKVNRVEIKEFILDEEMKKAMDMVLIAEREKRAVIIKSEGESQAHINRERSKAVGIELVRGAEALGYEKIKNVGVDEKVLKIRGYEALKDVADGKATKLFIPNDIGNLVTGSHVFADALKSNDQQVATEPAAKPEESDKE